MYLCVDLCVNMGRYILCCIYVSLCVFEYVVLDLGFYTVHLCECVYILGESV